MLNTAAKWVYSFQEYFNPDNDPMAEETRSGFALILEDDEFDAAVTRELLENSCDVKLSVECARTLKEAKELLRATAYEIVLVDMNVPDSAGLDTVRAVLEANPNVPVVVLTGYDDSGTALEALRIGAQDYLPKSGLDGNTLKRTVQYAIRRKEKETDLAQKAYYDPLTGLSNRVLLHERWGRSLARARRAERKVGVLIGDVNNFKIINDTYGHVAGDALLKHFAGLISENVRRSDIVARLGGDEFVVVLENIENKKQLDKIRDKLTEVCSTRLSHDRQIIPFSASFGGTIADPRIDEDLMTVIRSADEEMYKFKRQAHAVLPRDNPTIRQ